MPGPRALTTLVGLVGAATAVAGGLVLTSRRVREAEFGWFAYAPLTQTDLDRLVFVDEVRAGGSALVVAGLLLVAAAVGTRTAGPAGRRAASNRAESSRAESSRAERGRGATRGLLVVTALLVLAGLLAVLLPRTGVDAGEGVPYAGRAGWSFPTFVLGPVQVVGAGAVLLGLLIVSGVLGSVLAARGRA